MTHAFQRPSWRFAATIGVALLLLLLASPAHADEGWVIERYAATISIQPDSSLRITESIDVDFGALEKHGIFREVPVQYNYDSKHTRVYDLTVESVTDAAGKAWKYTTEGHGANERIKIGDANRTVNGKQTYRIAYRVRGALNPFADHDELFWNVNGLDWDVPVTALAATVTLAGGGLGEATCFVGVRGATDRCRPTPGDTRVQFDAARPLRAHENLTIVTSLRKGAVAEPLLLLEKKPRTFVEYFDTGIPALGGALVVLLGGLAFVGNTWWTRGRDRRFTSLYYLTQNPEEQIRPLLSKDQVVIEYQPPDGTLPAQMGILMHENVDKRDVTATIVGLAVRGYLSIEEIAPDGLMQKLTKHKDWTLTRKKANDDRLQKYESMVLNGLFTSGDQVKLSDLKTKCYKTLAEVSNEIYRDAAAQGWFHGNPKDVRARWAVIGVASIIVSAGVTFALGRFLGLGLVGLPLILVGLLIFLTANWMPRRTAQGSELLRRTLGFREYIRTAETDRQKFNEQANIFAEYLPYAIVFNCVDKWARAFRDIDTAAATAGWYSGVGAFSAMNFSQSMNSFSSNVSSTIASTPGGSGGSGFSGGSSGGGGGGGGGGSW